IKETSHVSLEYDPASRRKVLNTYEILRDIGSGEHGKVKLAKNLVNNELVAIKIVSRKPKDRRLRMRRPSAEAEQPAANAHEARIRREIAIMKRCDHPHIVRFKEVLDDRALLKIYLVLEYMDRGEIKWKRLSPVATPRQLGSTLPEQLPCWAGQRRASGLAPQAPLDGDLLSREFSPNLSFRQSRRIFRDVLLGLEYLHMRGIVHRDIKPANLLVSSDDTVKISDFGVSFASSLGSTEDGVYFSDMELAKTVGTPAFFAPELCQTSIADGNTPAEASAHASPPEPASPATARGSPSLPKVDHKIDIWALGVTLYCLLFGRVPFNADSEFALFSVIVNEELQFPDSRSSFCSPQEVAEEEFVLAKDLLRRMLDKNSKRRIDIDEIKRHAFVLMDLENDPAKLHEFYFLNSDHPHPDLDGKDRSQNCSPTVGAATRVGGIIVKSSTKYSTPSMASASATTVDGDAPHTAKEHGQSPMITLVDETGMANGSTASSLKGQKSPLPSPVAALGSAQCSPKLTHGSILTTSSQPNHTNPLIQSTSKASIAIGNSLLHDVMDFGSTLRRDSLGSLEAPRIETKRNVGGDLYMKTQSALEAFKDIQKSDDKRRKSSLFANLSRNSSLSVSGKQNNPSHDSHSQTQHVASIPIGSHVESSLSKIKVGPISIDSNRRPSSVISLPLTESFASLDSFNDAYLNSKYQEFKKKKHAMSLMNDSVTQSDSALAKVMDTSHGITEKFKNFNLGYLMARESKTSDVRAGTNHDEVEPRAAKKTFVNLHNSSDSESCSSQSSCSLNSSSENEEEGNLTLKFPSKVAPRLRPPFLTLGNRAFSHDSNLTELAHLPKTNYYTPYLFQELLLELEDVPESLMGGGPIPALPEPIPKLETVTEDPVTVGSPPLASQFLKSKIVQNNPAQSSPLRTEIVGTPDSSQAGGMMQVGLDAQLSRKDSEVRNYTIDRGYFNNHYKKEHVRGPLPFSKHLDADKESQSKLNSKSLIGKHVRPHYTRSNSITLGLLQHE
ncbi:Pkinase-domain-containing protein, partial [Metschnikowia bicuspidata var. bicuspidata NRRL YB-4993]